MLGLGPGLLPSGLPSLLAEGGVDGSRRPAELSLDEWKAVYYAFRSQEPGNRSQTGR